MCDDTVKLQREKRNIPCTHYHHQQAIPGASRSSGSGISSSTSIGTSTSTNTNISTRVPISAPSTTTADTTTTDEIHFLRCSGICYCLFAVVDQPLAQCVSARRQSVYCLISTLPHCRPRTQWAMPSSVSRWIVISCTFSMDAFIVIFGNLPRMWNASFARWYKQNESVKRLIRKNRKWDSTA